MRRKTVLAAVTAAILLVAVGASSAYAGSPIDLHEGLQLSEHGTPVAPGSTLVSEAVIVNGYCVEGAYAKLLNNGDPVDLVEVEAPWYDECESGTLSGGIDGVALSDTGAALVAANLTLTTPAGCTYALPFLLAGEFMIGDETVAYVVGDATGIRTGASSRSCARTLSVSYTVGEDGGVDHVLLNTELVPLKGFAFPFKTLRAGIRPVGHSHAG